MKDDSPLAGWDITRLGILLYAGGLLASLAYYSRFGIFSLDILRPQCILIGAAMMILYGVLPFFILRLASKLRPRRVQLGAAVLLLILLDWFFLYSLGTMGAIALLAVITCTILQLLVFSRGVSRGALVVSAVGETAWFLILLLIIVIHYAQFVHPAIPGYFGGGRPMTVEVYTEPQDIPADRFVRSKNRNRANKHRDSYRLRLLYETAQDYYFVERRVTKASFEGYAVIRIAKAKVLRIDYVTPSWVAMKGVD